MFKQFRDGSSEVQREWKSQINQIDKVFEGDIAFYYYLILFFFVFFLYCFLFYFSYFFPYHNYLSLLYAWKTSVNQIDEVYERQTFFLSFFYPTYHIFSHRALL